MWPVSLSQVGTGNVAAAWIGLRMFGVVEGEYLYVCLSFPVLRTVEHVPGVVCVSIVQVMSVFLCSGGWTGLR